ncbi:MAG: glycosyltransferase family 9 protein [Cyclobacteriaceae bacterium]|jgi:ADP-heptose:LPS heptosyltransferase
MKVDTMRFIDKWAGIPLVFILSVMLWILELFTFRRKTNPDLSNTLFIELSEMGSAVLADPAMRTLRKMGGGQLFFAIFESNYKSLQILKTVEEDHIFKMRSDNLLNLGIDVIRFFIWCRSKKITAVIDLELFSRFTAILSGISGAKYRIGFSQFHDEGMYRGFIINYPVRYNPHVHIAINFMSLVQRALNQFNNPYPTIQADPGQLRIAQADPGHFDINRVKEKLSGLYKDWDKKRIVLINPNASDLLPQRRWLPEYFVSVCRDILKDFEDVLIIATGAPSEKAYVQKVVDDIGNERCVNSAGIFDFLELIPLYLLSELMLTNDSGPAHFSSVTPLKVYVIMGPETPVLYGPLGNAEVFYLGLPCSPCVSAANHRKTTCITRPCISGISPESVYEKLGLFLSSAH